MVDDIERFSHETTVSPDRSVEAVEDDHIQPQRHLSTTSNRAYTFPALTREEQVRLYEFCGRVGLFGDQDFADKLGRQKVFRKRLRSGLLRCFRRQKVKLVYELACDGYEWARLWYFISRITVIGCLVMQIVIAGAITVLGAYGHYMISVTVLGAINVILAALLALMKGMNLTKSTYQSMNELEAVIDFINRTVKEFEYGGRVEIAGKGKVDLNAFQQSQIAWSMYNEAIKHKQSNHQDPDYGTTDVKDAKNKAIGITEEQREVGTVQIRHSGRRRNEWFSQIDW